LETLSLKRYKCLGKGTKKSHENDFRFIRNGVSRKIENTGFNYASNTKVER